MAPKTQAEIDAEKREKSRPDWIPGTALHEEGLVQGYGGRKHGECTWRVAGTEQAKPETHIASAMRHLIEILRHGPAARDPESGLLHAAHARAQLGIAIDCLYLHEPVALVASATPDEPTSAFAPGQVEGENPRRGSCSHHRLTSRCFICEPWRKDEGAT